MSKIYIREKNEGGFEIRAFVISPLDIGDFVEIESSFLKGINVDKSRILPNGKIIEDQSIVSQEDDLLNKRMLAFSKLISLGLSQEDIEVLFKI